MKRRVKRRLQELLGNMPEGYSYSNGYLRVDKEYPINFVLHNTGDRVVEFDGHRVKMNSLRYQTFSRSISCIVCGIEGRYFRLEKHALHADISGNSFHFNLYSVGDTGNEILMTRDHIVPKSKGGKNHISNMQTMCRRCNSKKGASQCKKHPTLELLYIIP